MDRIGVRRILAGTGLLILRRLLLFLVIIAVVTPIIFLRAGAVPHKGSLPEFVWNRYWPALVQYAGHLAHGSFGPLYQEPPLKGGPPLPKPTNAQIGAMLAQALPTSLLFFSFALGIGLVVGALAGLLSSRFARPWIRRLTGSVNILLLSFPDIVLIVLIQFALLKLLELTGIELLPAYGNWDGHLALRDAILPVLLLSIFPAAYTARLSATAFDSIFSSDYIRTARAKGLSAWRVTWGHALKNAVISLLAGIPPVAGIMISNLIILEYLLNIAGVGKMLSYELIIQVNAGAMNQGYPSPNLIASIVICLAAVFLVVDGLVDLLLWAIDPRPRDLSRPTARERTRLRRREARQPLGRKLAGIGSALLRAPATVLLWLRDSAGAIRLPDAETLRHRGRSLVQAYRGNLALAGGTLIVLLLVLVAVFAPWLAPRNPYQMTSVIMKDAKTWLMPPYPPFTPGLPLGTDQLGQDLLSRVIYGTRFTLLVCLVVVPLRMLLAVPLGLAAAWFRGPWEKLVTGAALVIGAIPALVIPALLAPVIFPPPAARTMFNPNAAPPPNPLYVLMLHAAILVLLGWPRMAESVRLRTREVESQPFMEGARAVGAKPSRLMFRHILPHLTPTLTVAFAAEMGWLMMLLAQLGAMGIWIGGAIALEKEGLVPAYPDWSQMLSNPNRYMRQNHWIIIVPAVAFVIAILGFNLLAEGIRRAQQRAQGA